MLLWQQEFFYMLYKETNKYFKKKIEVMNKGVLCESSYPTATTCRHWNGSGISKNSHSLLHNLNHVFVIQDVFLPHLLGVVLHR